MVTEQYFSARVEATVILKTKKLIPNFGAVTVTSAEQFLMFHVPFVMTTGWNQQWAYSHGLLNDADDGPGSSDYVGGSGSEVLGTYLHGTIAENMFSIMSEGRMRPSTENT